MDINFLPAWLGWDACWLTSILERLGSGAVQPQPSLRAHLVPAPCSTLLAPALALPSPLVLAQVPRLSEHRCSRAAWWAGSAPGSLGGLWGRQPEERSWQWDGAETF